MGKNFSFGPGRVKHILAAIPLIPAVFAAVILQYYPPPVIDLFVYGGTGVFLYNLCVLILAPYFVLFILALGNLYLSRWVGGDVPHPLGRVDLLLISFFAGCGVLTVLGFVLGLLKLLYFWVCFPLFIIVIYIYFLRFEPGQSAIRLWEWVSASEIKGNFKVGLSILRVSLLAVFASILLTKGILLELFKDGGLHQYFAYFAETRLNHSTWMDPSHPILYDYLSGRGQGVYLFFTSFTNQFTIQVVGAIYLIMIGAVARQVIQLLSSILGKMEDRFPVGSYLPELAMLLVLTSPILDMEPARFHPQTGAFFLFLAWACPLFLVLEDKHKSWLFFSSIPIVIAFPITSGIYYAFVGWILGILFLSLLITRRNTVLKYPLLLLLWGGVSAVLSFSLNWLYVGVPELQPSSVFTPLVWMERFQGWSSRGLIYYLDSSMGNSVSPSSVTFQMVRSNTLALFTYPSSLLRDGANHLQDLVPFYPILVIAILAWLGFGYLRGKNTGGETGKPGKTFFKYWLTFTLFYILNIALVTMIQQSSLKRMLLFMGAYPILTFFAIIVFLAHRFGNMSRGVGAQTSQWVGDIFPSIKKDRRIAILASMIWGGCFTLGLINLWPYFARRSLLVQIGLSSLVMALGASLFFLALNRIGGYYDKLTGIKKIVMLTGSFTVSLLLAVFLFLFTPLSRNIPVPHTLNISAVDHKNPASSSSAVGLLEVKIDGKSAGFGRFEQSGEWSMTGGALQSRGSASLAYTYYAGWDSTVEILFEKSSSAGFAKIEYDDQAPVLKDLYFDGRGHARYINRPSPFGNKTSVLYLAILFAAEYVVILGLAYILLAFLSLPNLYSGVFLLLGLTMAAFQLQVNLGTGRLDGAWRYFTGREGAVKAYGPVISYGINDGDRSDVLYCLEILKEVPGPAQVLNLNGFAAVEPCLFSPLLPRDKIVHHYEAVAITEPYYQTLMFGEPQAAYKMYKDLGINYFYIRKGDLLFVNLGYSRALEPQNLRKYFDVYAESDDFYILTWRGSGLHPVSPHLAEEIAVWYNDSKDANHNGLRFWWLGREDLETWVQLLP